MTPGARLEAAIELLGKIATARRPADDIVRGWIKARRFIGAKDRRAIRDRIYDILRRQNRLDWHLETNNAEATPRNRALADVVLVDRTDPSELFDGKGHAPAPLSNQEQELALALVNKHLEDPGMPGHVLVEVPGWMAPGLQRFLGERYMAEMAALNQPAPMDLRVNLARVTRDQAQKSLAKDGVNTSPTPLSPLGLRLGPHSDIARTKAFKTGLIEVQDEGSQLLALLVDTKPAMAVCDYCAGAGGKTLALADRLGLQGGAGINKARLVACDTEESRLVRMDRRLGRAKLEKLVERHVLTADDDWAKQNEAAFDRVLVDAPCTGTGTWRRHPEQKKRLTEERLSELVAVQKDILQKAAPLVAPGGRLVYATCSILEDENEAQVTAFLEGHPGFAILPTDLVWAGTVKGVPYPSDFGDTLRLSPASHGTDGFFISVLERQS